MTAVAATRRLRRQGGPHRTTVRSGRCRVRATTAARVAAVTLAATSASWSLALRAEAAAGTGASLQAQAAAISATISADDTSLQELGERYLREHQVYDDAVMREAVLRRAISRTDAAVAHDRRQLRDAAVSAYVNAGSDSSLTLYLGGNVATLSSGQTYLRVASDQLGDDVAKLRDDEHALATSLATEARTASTAKTALAETTAARSSVLRTVTSEQHLLSSVRGRLAALVRAEQLARERAAARAEARAAAAQAAAARAAAARAAAATTTTAPGAAGSGKSSSGSGSSGGSGTSTTGGGTSGTSAPTTDADTGVAPTSGSPATTAGPPAPTGVPSSTSPIPAGNLAQEFAGIRECESSDDYSMDTGNGYYGAYQFSESTWEGLGGSGLPSAAPPAEQDAKAYVLYEESGWASWPECAAVLGLA